MYLTDLAKVLRADGLTVIEEPGWQTRGRSSWSVEAIVWHHTVTGTNWTDRRVADLLRYGRSDLPGPLSQLGLDRQGRYWLIAAGRSNHNGYGTHGNNSIGIEAFNDGQGEPWPRVQLDAYDRGTAALCRAYKIPAARVKGHKETDPRRKIDPYGINMDAARQRVAHLITYRPPAKPTPTPPTTPGKDWLAMATEADLKRVIDEKVTPTLARTKAGSVLLFRPVNGDYIVLVPNTAPEARKREVVDIYIFTGAAQRPPTAPRAGQTWLSVLPVVGSEFFEKYHKGS